MAHDPTRPSSRPPIESPSDRLDSWKDIAAYLQRDVSTVQRWEKREGMPVQRHVHEKQGTVYAFRSELDAWGRGRGVRLAQQDQEEPDPARPPPPFTRVEWNARLNPRISTAASRHDDDGGQTVVWFSSP